MEKEVVNLGLGYKRNVNIGMVEIKRNVSVKSDRMKVLGKKMCVV